MAHSERILCKDNLTGLYYQKALSLDFYKVVAFIFEFVNFFNSKIHAPIGIQSIIQSVYSKKELKSALF